MTPTLTFLGAILWYGELHSAIVGRDAIWKSPALPHARVLRIAVLPVVSVTDDHRAELLVEDCVERQSIHDAHAWIQAKESADRLRSAVTEHDSPLRAVSRQVFRRARVDAPTARRISRLLSADALLSIRIDRWERWVGGAQHESEFSAERTAALPVRAFVRLEAALLDSDGNVLWRFSGREAVKTPLKLLAKLDTGPGNWELRERYGFGIWPEDFRDAVSALVDRWMSLLPPRS